MVTNVCHWSSHISQNQKSGSIGREAGGETTVVAARDWIPNGLNALRNIPLCLVCWPPSRCFPGMKTIVCNWETTAGTLLITLFNSLRDVLRWDLDPEPDGEGNYVCVCRYINSTYTSLNSSREVAGVKTSRSPITYNNITKVKSRMQTRAI